MNTVSIDECSERWAVTRGKRAWPGEERVVEERCGGAGEVLFCFLRAKLEHEFSAGGNKLVEGKDLNL